jgi:hypothetical protein
VQAVPTLVPGPGDMLNAPVVAVVPKNSYLRVNSLDSLLIWRSAVRIRQTRTFVEERMKGVIK